MMNPPLAEYPHLKAPRQDGETLLWPEARELRQITRVNSDRLRSDERVRLCGLPLGRIRSWQRRWLGHADNDRLLVATGHQAELYHAGVWAKNCAIDSLARAVNGVAVHFSVDTDSPKHLAFRSPGATLPVTDDSHAARWSALLRSPQPSHVELLRQQVETVKNMWGFVPMAESFVEVMQRLSTEAVDLPAALVNAHHQVDRELGLRHGSLVASPMWQSTGYLVFVYDLLSRADSFAAAYNQALASFRQRHAISSPGRPMPDLPVDSAMCEAPFWLDFLEEGARKRALVSRDGDNWALHAAGDVFEFAPPRDGWAAGESLQSWLKAHKLRLSPRALTLTMFLRLCVVDQFVHGIGGALYDQVSDEVIAGWYGIEPPAFSVATATLLFPAAAGREQVCLGCLRSEGRRLHHASLGRRKRELVEQIERAPRRSLPRQQLYMEMQRELRAAAQASAELATWRHRYAEAESQHEVEQAIFDREIPYIMQPAERLESLVARFDALFED